MVVVINEKAGDAALLRTEIVLASARGIPILPVLADSVKADKSRIAELRRSVRARDDTLVLYELQWFSSHPTWDAMVASLSEKIGANEAA
jgi:transposase-like protein